MLIKIAFMVVASIQMRELDGLFESGYVDYLITGNKRHFPADKRIITAREFFDKYEPE